tara:strand:+ start:86 stop:595 length:510 start_codon:yes stop_codon:yes gene_type:complete
MKFHKIFTLLFVSIILLSCNNYYDIYLQVPESQDDNVVLNSNSDLETIQKQFIGQWEGEAIPPSTWTEPYTVSINFNADGTYSAKNNTPKSGVSAFYYGTDDDSDLKVFDIYNLYSTGKATANITIAFTQGTTNSGRLNFITMSEDYNQLTFEFWKGNYGPIKYNLTRK